MTAKAPVPPPSELDARQQLREALQLESVGLDSWRVCDRRVGYGGDRFLAFVERKDDGFEVMQLADEFVWTVFPSLSVALAYVVETAGTAFAASSAKDSGRR